MKVEHRTRAGGLTVALLLLASACRQAKQYREWWVAPDGRATDCSPEVPCPAPYVFRGADGLLKPGDVVWFEPGIYHERATIHAHGTRVRPIAFLAYPGEKLSVLESGVDLTDSDHITLRGFWLGPPFKMHGPLDHARAEGKRK